MRDVSPYHVMPTAATTATAGLGVCRSRLFSLNRPGNIFNIFIHIFPPKNGNLTASNTPSGNMDVLRVEVWDDDAASDDKKVACPTTRPVGHTPRQYDLVVGPQPDSTPLLPNPKLTTLRQGQALKCPVRR